MNIEFDKMEGAGNDFILIDNRNSVVADADKLKLVVDYCRPHQGIGADGMIFVQTDPEYDFSWDFYNADGSKAEMCGNGARCVARYANKIGAAGTTMIFRSLAGPIKGELTQRGAKVQLSDAALPASAETLDVNGEKISLWFINTGVPHAVVKVEDVEKVDVEKMGAALRHHSRFAPSGTNVNFFSLGQADTLVIRTFERGVEGETLACGTGSVAASIIAGKFLGKTSPITVLTRSEEELVIHFTLEKDCAKNVFLEGGARLVFSGVFTV